MVRLQFPAVPLFRSDSEQRRRLGVRSTWGAAPAPLGSETVPLPGDAWVFAEPGFEAAPPGTRIDVLRDAPWIRNLAWDRETLVLSRPGGGDPERPAWRVGEVEISHGNRVAAFTILETAPGWTRLGPGGPAVVDLLRRARSLTLADALRAPESPMRRTFDPWRKVPVPQSEVVEWIGMSMLAPGLRDVHRLIAGPKGNEAAWLNLERIVEGAAAALAAGPAAPDLLFDGLLDAWRALGPVEPHPDPWAAPLPDPRREALARAFPLLARAQEHPLYVGLGQEPPVRVDLITIWPLGMDRDRYSRVGGFYPDSGDVLAAGTRIRQTGGSDPEFGDFWKILDGPRAGELAILGGIYESPPTEWALVLPAERLAVAREAADRLFAEIEAAVAPRP